MDPSELMELAISRAREGIAAGQSPFGCAIALDGRVIAATHNSVLSQTDVTAHAEINALRIACAATHGIHLEGAIVASTCEPCPMCAAALHWARVDTVYYGAAIADAEAAGFNELRLAAADMLQQGESGVRLKGGLLANQCRGLFDEWTRSPGRQAY